MEVKVHEQVPQPPPKTYDLVGLTEEDARALFIVSQLVGGDRVNSLRRVFDRLDTALHAAGVQLKDYRETLSGSAINQIYFKDGKF